MPETAVDEGLYPVVGSFGDTPGFAGIQKNTLHIGIKDSELFRVLVHAKIFSLRTAEQSVHKKSSAVRTAGPYPFTKIFIRSITVHVIRP